MTFDGKIATRSGSSQWITGPQARAYGHKLRRKNDVIITGVGSILSDNSQLTARDPKTNQPTRNQPARLILDSRARTPVTAKLFEFTKSPILIATTNAAPQERLEKLRVRAEILIIPAVEDGRVDLQILLTQLANRGYKTALVEGGAQVITAFLENQRAHEIAFFYAPKILAQSDALKCTLGMGTNRSQDAIRLKSVRYRKLGDDLLLRARVVFSP